MTALSVVLNSRDFVRNRRTHTRSLVALRPWIQHAASSNAVIDSNTIETHGVNGSGLDDS